MPEAYFDTSALVRLLHEEQYSDSLKAFINNNRIDINTSDLSRTEVIKALGSDRYDEAALRRFFADITIHPIPTSDFEAAGSIGLAENLRSLDAIHIQSALSLALPMFITYDKRQAETAENMGLQVIAPGMD